MHNTMLKFSILTLMLTVASLRSTNRIVDGPGGSYYATIQAAVSDAVSDVDSILLEAGMTFTGPGNYNVDLAGKTLTFDRTGTGDDPIIDLESNGRLFTIVSTQTISMSNLVIKNGTDDNFGGAISTTGTLNIEACTFSGNSAVRGGAIYNIGGILNLEACIFTGNNCTSSGNIAFGGAIHSESGVLNITTCVFNGNSATVSTYTARGGAINNTNSYLNLTLSEFYDNSVTGSSDVIGGAISSIAESTLNISDCIFRGNSATVFESDALGGAIYSVGAGGILNVMRCTFYDNSATGPTLANGGAICNYLSTCTVSCSRIVNNTASSAGDAMYAFSNVTVTNNWWGTNDDPSTVPNLFGGIENITYDPWITASLTRLIPEGMDTSIKITFSSGCLPDGTPVAFSTTDGTITPTLALTIDGVATTTLSGYGALQLTLTATIGPDVETYVLSNIATSIPVNPYRFNFGCICSDTGGEHILIGSHNMTSLDGNSLDCWTFNETPTVSFINSLDLGQQIIMDSATYNTEAGMNIVLLTQTQEGDTAIVLVTYDGVSTVSQSSTPLSSQAFKAQWFVSSNGTPYIVADTQDGMSLYEVDLTSYTVTLSSSVPNLGAGMPSAFLRWYPQGDSLYVIQGYNQTSIATYKVDLTTGTIEPGLPTGLSGDFTAINSCATCYGDLVIGGAGSGEEALLMRCTVLEAGDLKITQTASIPGAVYIVNYCERCCCGDNPILVGTDNGLYSLDANTLDVVASNTLMPNNVWINTCWCCDSTGDYCIAVNSAHETYVFQQEGSSLTQVLQLPSELYPTSQEGVTEEEPAVDPTEPTADQKETTVDPTEPVVEIPEEVVPE